MKNILLFLITVFSVTSQAQVAIQVSNQESKENIEFASILLPDYKKSFVADEHGKFIIDTNTYKLPLKVLIEQFGFKSKEINLQNNTKAYNIYLNPSSELLREIIIPPKNAKIKERIYGRTNEGSGNIVGTFKDYSEENIHSGLEFGLVINTNNKLKKVKKIHWHINDFSLQKAVYGLQFYEVGNGKPTNRIAHEDINFTVTDKSKGWVVIDVEDLNIYIDGTKKIAAILKTQKVETKKGTKNGSITVNIGIPAVSNTIVGRDSQYEEWEKVPMNYPFYITVDSYE